MPRSDFLPGHPRDFVIRRLKGRVGDQQLRISAGGYGIEILHGGNGGYRNVLRIGLGQEGTTGTNTDLDAQIRCNSGARLACRFDFLELIPADANQVDEVILKVFTSPRAGWVDTDPAGKPRVRMVYRSTAPQALSGLSSAYLMNLAASPFLPYNDRHFTRETHDLVYWYGWVAGDAPFTLWVFANNDPGNISEKWYAVQSMPARNMTTTPAALIGATEVAGYVADFCNGSGVATSAAASGQPIALPAGAIKIGIENTGAGGLNFSWNLGFKGG